MANTERIILYPHGFQFGADYSNYKDAVADVIIESSPDNKSAKEIQAYMDELYDLTSPSKMDTSIGGNEVINPYTGGDPDDDIIFLLNDIGKDGKQGLGNVYKEAIQDTQKVLWFTFGMPKFNNLEGFYGVDKSSGEDVDGYANVITKGTDEEAGNFFTNAASGFASFVGNTAKTVGKLAIRLPFVGFRAANWLGDQALNDTITKYYDFEPAMIQYYKLYNSIIGVLAVQMNLYGNGDGVSSSNVEALLPSSSIAAGGALTLDQRKNYVEQEAAVAAKKASYVNRSGTTDENSNGISSPMEAIPEILQNGPDIFTILDKRRRFNGNKKEIRSLDTLSSFKDAVFNWKNSLDDSMAGGDQFIGFRVEKGTDSYETISNTTGESEIAGILNNTSEKMKSSMFSFMGLSFGGEGGEEGTSVSGIADWIASAVGRSDFGQAKTLFTGNGYFDIPEVWKNSSFTKSYTFSIELESRLGDPVSIYQNIYIPLAGLLAAACPRAVSKNMYTSPFILQAYCQGMFAIPLGIIDNITIKRGSSDYGWTYSGLPTTVSVSFSIKDLSPAMFLSLYGEGFTNIFKSNSSMHEYLATLSGLGLAERKRFGKRMKRRFEAAMLLHRTTTFNPMFWSTSWGNSRFLRTVGTFTMPNKWPE